MSVENVDGQTSDPFAQAIDLTPLSNDWNGREISQSETDLDKQIKNISNTIFLNRKTENETQDLKEVKNFQKNSIHPVIPFRNYL